MLGPDTTWPVRAERIIGWGYGIAGYFARTPDFSQPPFNLLGRAYREGGQWRWENPFLEVVPAL